MTTIKLSMKKRKREDSVQFITRIMHHSKNGPMMQGFIIDALTKQAERIVNTGIVGLAVSMNDSFISPQAWFDCASELKTELDERYAKEVPNGG